MGLALVHARKVPRWPWELAWLDGRNAQYATCRTCERDVAQPKANAREVPVCLYCAMDSGLVEPVDVPLSAINTL